MTALNRWRYWLENSCPHWVVAPVVIVVSVSFFWLTFPIFSALLTTLDWLSALLGSAFPYEAIFWVIIAAQIGLVVTALFLAPIYLLPSSRAGIGFATVTATTFLGLFIPELMGF